MTPFYDTTEILGGKATVYRREPGVLRRSESAKA